MLRKTELEMEGVLCMDYAVLGMVQLQGNSKRIRVKPIEYT